MIYCLTNLLHFIFKILGIKLPKRELNEVAKVETAEQPETEPVPKPVIHSLDSRIKTQLNESLTKLKQLENISDDTFDISLLCTVETRFRSATHLIDVLNYLNQEFQAFVSDSTHEIILDNQWINLSEYKLSQYTLSSFLIPTKDTPTPLITFNDLYIVLVDKLERIVESLEALVGHPNCDVFLVQYIDRRLVRVSESLVSLADTIASHGVKP